LDEELAYDTIFQRHVNRVLRQLIKFKPDVIHITGLNDVSVIGVYLAWKLQIPLLGSWHTNLHEFAASRIERLLRFLPAETTKKIAKFAQKHIMKGAVLYYRMPKVILAPNQELVDELGRRTKRQAQIMGRGVDTDFFSPAKRTADGKVFTLGFVGRLRAEKNVRLLIKIEEALRAAGKKDFRFLIVGEGNEREHLEEKMKTGEFTGFLDGEQLAEAYANMDVFVFPSETDAFGNVSQEAHASGVPTIVSDKGGPKFTVIEGETGFVAGSPDEFIKYSLQLFEDRELLNRMKLRSREEVMERSWDSIFESVYDGYRDAIRLAEKAERKAAGKNG
jgi:glycosyltransferase involved in cell wall biosynthesis